MYTPARIHKQSLRGVRTYIYEYIYARAIRLYSEYSWYKSSARNIWADKALACAIARICWISPCIYREKRNRYFIFLRRVMHFSFRSARPSSEFKCRSIVSLNSSALRASRYIPRSWRESLKSHNNLMIFQRIFLTILWWSSAYDETRFINPATLSVTPRHFVTFSSFRQIRFGKKKKTVIYRSVFSSPPDCCRIQFTRIAETWTSTRSSRQRPDEKNVFPSCRKQRRLWRTGENARGAQ